MNNTASFFYRTSIRLSLLLLLCGSYPAAAQEPVWREAEGTTGLFFSDIAVYASDHDSVYALGDSLMVSSDSGESWFVVAPGNPLGAIAIDSSDSERLTLNESRVPFHGNALHLSVNGGEKWTQILTGFGHAPPLIEQDPVDAARIYAVANPFFVVRSTDRGQTWDTLGLSARPGLSAIAISPTNGDFIYIGYSLPVTIVVSTDGGSSWDEVSSPLEGINVPISLNVDPEDPLTVYAGLDGYGIFRSTDGGNKWVGRNTGLKPENRDVRDLVIDPVRPGEIFIALGDSNPNDGVSDLVYASSDGGGLWSRLSEGLPLSGHVSVLTFDPRGDRIYAGSNSGLFVLDRVTGIVEEEKFPLPITTRLFPNSPNPFNSSTRIHFEVSHETNVSIRVFNLLGQEVGIVVDQPFLPGRYSEVFDASHLTSGVYYYGLRSDRAVEFRPMLLLK